MNRLGAKLGQLVQECRSEPDLEKRIQMLFFLNSMVPASRRLRIPSLLTRDYVNKALEELEFVADEFISKGTQNQFT